MSGRGSETGGGEQGGRGTWLEWLVERAVNLTPERRQEVTDELFPEGPALRSYLYRFAVLQSLAVLIATFGLISDSAAVVIGAMLVAPLMRPVLSVAAAMVSGWPVRQGTFFTVVVLTSAGSVFLAWATAELLLPDSTPISAEILARTSPTLIDVGIALAAGCGRRVRHGTHGSWWGPAGGGGRSSVGATPGGRRRYFRPGKDGPCLGLIATVPDESGGDRAHCSVCIPPHRVRPQNSRS